MCAETKNGPTSLYLGQPRHLFGSIHVPVGARENQDHGRLRWRLQGIRDNALRHLIGAATAKSFGLSCRGLLGEAFVQNPRRAAYRFQAPHAPACLPSVRRDAFRPQHQGLRVPWSTWRRSLVWTFSEVVAVWTQCSLDSHAMS